MPWLLMRGPIPSLRGAATYTTARSGVQTCCLPEISLSDSVGQGLTAEYLTVQATRLLSRGPCVRGEGDLESSWAMEEAVAAEQALREPAPSPTS